MDFFGLLTDPKVLLIIAVLALLIALAIYAWRQSSHLEDLKTKNTKMLEQVKHGIILDDEIGYRAKLRNDMASNMSEETIPVAHSLINEHEHDHSASEHAVENTEWEDDECSDEEHNTYIKELIRLNDSKRAKNDEFYIKTQQQTGHNGPVYDSGEEDVIFDNYDDTEDEASETDILVHAERELAEADPVEVAPVQVAKVAAPAKVAPVVVATPKQKPELKLKLKPSPKTPEVKANEVKVKANEVKVKAEAVKVKANEVEVKANTEEITEVKTVEESVKPVEDVKPTQKLKPFIGKKVPKI